MTDIQIRTTLHGTGDIVAAIDILDVTIENRHRTRAIDVCLTGTAEDVAGNGDLRLRLCGGEEDQQTYYGDFNSQFPIFN